MRGKFRAQRVFCGIVLCLIVTQMYFAMCLATDSPNVASNSLPYSELGYVTYRIQITTTINNWESILPASVNVYVPRFQNWSIEVPEQDSSLQASSMSNATVPSPSYANYTQKDLYNNTFDYYQTSIGHSDAFVLYTNYTLTARQIRWDNLGSPKMADYDTGSFLYKLYTQNQPEFINLTDPAIIAKATEICGTENNPVEKARKIYSWVTTNIVYQLQNDAGSDGTGEKGASWALANLKGDCSEFSDLMVALLRAQGVPARKVVGIVMLDSKGSQFPSYAEDAGWNYYKYQTSDNYTGHAWIEYFVPGAGWVSCDPTWGNAGLDFFNYIDHLHVSVCRGEYFGDEVYPTITSWFGKEIGEYPFIPLVSYSSGLDVRTKILTRVSVLDSHIWVDNTGFYIFIGIIIAVAVIALIYWGVSSRKRRNQPGPSTQIPLEI